MAAINVVKMKAGDQLCSVPPASQAHPFVKCLYYMRLWVFHGPLGTQNHHSRQVCLANLRDRVVLRDKRKSLVRLRQWCESFS